MGKEQRSGNGKAIVVFFLVIILIAGVFVLVKLVYPEALDNVARGWANETLLQQNEQLSGQLNQTQLELLNVTDERDRLAWDLRQEQTKRFLWPLLIGVIIVGLLFLWLWAKFRRKARGLTLDEAKKAYLSRIRKTYGFSEQLFPGYPKITGRGFERVGRSQNDKDEAYFFIEYEFYPKDGHGYVRGVRSAKRNVVTIAMLNFRHETHRTEYPGITLDRAVEHAHKIELWGFHLQKSAREDDINKLIQDANSIKEIKKAVADEQEGSGA